MKENNLVYILLKLAYLRNQLGLHPHLPGILHCFGMPADHNCRTTFSMAFITSFLNLVSLYL